MAFEASRPGTLALQAQTQHRSANLDKHNPVTRFMLFKETRGVGGQVGVGVLSQVMSARVPPSLRSIRSSRRAEGGNGHSDCYLA